MRAHGARRRTRRSRSTSPSSLRLVANAGSLASSPGSKRRFSTIITSPGASDSGAIDGREVGDAGRERHLACRATRPAVPRPARASTAGRPCPSGGRNASSTRSRSARSRSHSIVGSDDVMRRSSSISPSRIGMLKSARTSTRVPRCSGSDSSCGIGSTTVTWRPGTRRGRRGGWSSPTRCRTSRAP